jgi:hypothetical protein
MRTRKADGDDPSAWWLFQRKEWEKSPFVGGDVWLGHGAYGQVWITRSFLLHGSHPCFRWAPPFQAGCGLTSSYNKFCRFTLKTAITFVIGCADKMEEPGGVIKLPKSLKKRVSVRR